MHARTSHTQAITLITVVSVCICSWNFCDWLKIMKVDTDYIGIGACVFSASVGQISFPSTFFEWRNRNRYKNSHTTPFIIMKCFCFLAKLCRRSSVAVVCVCKSCFLFGTDTISTCLGMVLLLPYFCAVNQTQIYPEKKRFSYVRTSVCVCCMRCVGVNWRLNIVQAFVRYIMYNRT